MGGCPRQISARVAVAFFNKRRVSKKSDKAKGAVAANSLCRPLWAGQCKYTTPQKERDPGVFVHLTVARLSNAHTANRRLSGLPGRVICGLISMGIKTLPVALSSHTVAA